ncbi:oligosaccharide repeat unit polymerase [Qiania dongpingensis]|uniref:Oligosaccharide repeat unit polymerase n=2 Tax=Qiania dongpingensis TaxID=2763669 RepID=A0A7G9G870_9FIRM|nr:oligosaccharide repeat unit polymerase [Qiania dongpingensis]
MAANLGIYILGCVLACVLSKTGEYVFSGFVLIMLAAGEYAFYFRRHGYLFQMEAVFSLFWTGGMGLSAMKLSRLAEDWEYLTWISFTLAYIFFILGYEWAGRRECAGRELFRKLRVKIWGDERTGKPGKDETAKRLFRCILAILLVSYACFLLEAAVIREIPLFSDKPHAYSYFHLSGVHYFTVSSIFVLPLSVLYKKVRGKLSVKEWTALGVSCCAALAIPVLCVSRFQLMLAVLLSICVAVAAYPQIKLRYIILVLAALIPVYVGLTVARNHDVAYLNGIFEMKNAETPIFVTQPYMYVANNYDNFNCLVKELPAHTFGLRQLFPVFALTGLKFLAPGLVNFPIYVTKTELTTVTLIYDAYYDFGVWGVALFGLVLGMACRKVASSQKKSGNPVSCLFYAQIAMYLVFSFFTTWFSNPTTWFWLGLTAIIYVYVGHRQKEYVSGKIQL